MADELKDQRIPIMMSPSEVKVIDDWMFSSRIKSRSEAIRRLCQIGLAATEGIEKSHASCHEMAKEMKAFGSKEHAALFKEMDAIGQLAVTKELLTKFFKLMPEPYGLTRDLYDLVFSYQNIDFPNELGFPDRKIVKEAIEMLRTEYQKSEIHVQDPE